MTAREADTIARRLWERGRAVRSLGECIMGPTRPDGTFAAVYRGKAWGPVVRRAMRNLPYDTPLLPSVAEYRAANL